MQAKSAQFSGTAMFEVRLADSSNSFLPKFDSSARAVIRAKRASIESGTAALYPLWQRNAARCYYPSSSPPAPSPPLNQDLISALRRRRPAAAEGLRLGSHPEI
jgi:hypothetical protein